jgi:hypothetical protein
VHRRRAVCQGEVGRHLAGLCGARAAIARGQKGDGRYESQDEATRKPHILIIRSVSPEENGAAQ